MVIVLLGGLPTVRWLRSYAIRSQSFLGNLLLQQGIRPAAVVGTPLPLRPILGEWWRRNGLGLPRVLARRYADRRHNGAAASVDASTPKARGKENAPVHMVSSVRDRRCASILSDLKPDLIVYLGGREIIPKRVLEIPRLGVLGAHWGPLPHYRGMNVTEWAIFNGDPPAVSVQFLSAGVDTGDIVLQRPLPVHQGDTLDTLRERSSDLGTQLLAEAVLMLNAGETTVTPQRLDEGRQYFVMDARLKHIAERRVADVAVE